ncbi:MAG: lytic transglycosylase domain-containing protein [Thermaerobacter sp.]|nr:lytic transglycosylase domain-containing protein [Thermaerobacter sp.]
MLGRIAWLVLIYLLPRRPVRWPNPRVARMMQYVALWAVAMAIAYGLGHGTGTGIAADEQQAAQRYDVPVALVKAVVQVESGGNPYAASDKGALGLMQATSDKFRPGQDPFSPATNLDVGTRYLASMLREFHGNLSLALAAYNAGPAAVKSYGGVPPYPETKAYVRQVLATYHRLLGKRH